MFLSAVWTHSDGTHSLQRIHWCANDAVLNFSKSVLMIFKNFGSQDVSTFSSWGILFLQPFFKYCINIIHFIRWFLWIQTQKQICICVLALISASICMCVFVDGLTATSTLSAQSAPSVYPPQQGFLAPGGMIDGGSSPLLQSFKPSPSNENLCSAYTSDATLSAPSLCLTSQGKNKET